MISIASAFGDSARGGPERRRVAVGSELPETERAALKRAIAARGLDYVGQEVVRLSTMPRWEDGKLAPRPFVLRVYAAATPDGWKVMPGGFARVTDKPDARAVSMGEGVESADVWVLADKPVVTSSLLPNPEKTHIARLLGNLPSRSADNLFWFGRYLERTEATMRLVRCLSARAVDPEAPATGARGVVEGLKGLLLAWGAVDAEAKDPRPAETALRSRENYGSALSLANCRQLRRLGYPRAVDAADLDADRPAERRPARTPRARLERRRDHRPHRRATDHHRRAVGAVRRELQPRRGLALLRTRPAHRARHQHLPDRPGQFGHQKATEHDLDVLLDLIDSQITYHSRTLIGVALAPVRDMALLDPYNPRSVAFQTERIAEHIGALAGAAAGRHPRGAAAAGDPA